VPSAELIQAKVDVEECLYTASVAHYSLGNYEDAKGLLERLLRSNPEHRYANELYTFVKDAQGVWRCMGPCVCIPPEYACTAPSRRAR
jgi:tetratricopeptide (TPR) repeat protein